MRTKLLFSIFLMFGLYNMSIGQNCISNITIEQDDCDAFGDYTAFVSFEHNPNVTSVSLFFDGEFFGNHSAAFQPIVLADLPFNSDGNNIHSIELIDAQNDTCRDSISFEAVCNFGIDDCLSEIFFVDAFCIDSALQFEINYTFLNPATEGHVYVNDEFIANASVGENQTLSFSVNSINPQSVYEVVVRDAEFPSCGDTLTTQVAPCSTECTAPFDISTTCKADGTYDISLFHQDNETTKVYVNDQFISQVTADSNNPFLIEGIQIDPSQVGQTITTCLVSSPTCCRTLTFEQPACETCDINLTLNEIICDGFAPAFDISYDYVNPAGGAQFIVNGSIVDNAVDGVNNSIFLNPEILNDQGLYTIILQDTSNQTCGDTLLIDNFFCSECDLAVTNLVTECIGGTNNYLIELDIVNTGTTQVDELFIAHQTGETFGPFTDINNEGTIAASFETATSLQGQFRIFDTDGLCNVFFNTEVNCDPNVDCSITNVLLDFECIDEDNYQVFLTFDHTGVEGDTVVVNDANGDLVGFFDVNQQPIVIDVNNTNGNNNSYGVFIEDPLDLACSAGSSLLQVDCNATEPCAVEFIEIISRECNTDGTYNLTVTYEITNSDNDFIDVTVNGGQQLSFDNTGTLVVSNITPIPNSDFDIIEICLNDNANCCLANEYDQPDCIIDNVCEIGPIDHEIICTDSTGAFMVQLFFDASNTTGEVTVSNFSGELLGQFGTTQTPILVGPFTADDLVDDGIGFTVCDAQLDGCCAENFVNNIPCMLEVEECAVEFIEVISRECNSDGTYNLTVTYEITNSDNDFIDVTVNGGSVLSFDNSGSITVSNITPRLNSDFDIIEICLNDNDNCCLVNEYQQPNCTTNEDCAIGGIEYEAICIDSSGTFMMNLFFNKVNTSGEVRVTTFTGEILGQFGADQQPVSVGPFTEDDIVDNGIGFIICDVQIDDCCSEIFATDIECEQDTQLCEIEFVEIISTDCNADSTYNLTASYSIVNGNNEFIDVTVNGGPVQTLDNSGSIILSNITARSNSDFDIIEICLNDNPDCCEVIEYAQPVCTDGPQECNLEIGDVGFFCNADGQIIFQLDVITTAANEFIVFVNGVELGTETANGMLTEVGPIDQNSDGFYQIEIIDTNDATCRSEFELLQAFCTEDCFIGDLDVEIECLNDGVFAAIITFEYDANHQDGVTIMGNGVVYGIFDGLTQPITLDSLIANANDEWEFLVIDNQDDACQAVAELGEINCSAEEVECIIENIEVFNLDCIGDNEYEMSVSFETGTNANIPFSFFVNGVPMNTATTNSLPLNVFGVVPSDSSTMDVITICLDDLEEECCVDFSYEQPECLFNSVVDKTLLDGLTISPNPASDILFINDIPNDVIGLNIVDNLGRTVEQLTTQNNLNIDVTNYLSGLYTIQFFTKDNRVMNRRFIKM